MMSYNEFIGLQVGDKIINIKGKQFKKNKDKFAFGVHSMIGYIHKNNYKEFEKIC